MFLGKFYAPCVTHCCHAKAVGKKISKTILKANHTTLPSNLRIESTPKDTPSSSCKIPYEAPPNVHTSQACKSRRKNLLP